MQNEKEKLKKKLSRLLDIGFQIFQKSEMSAVFAILYAQKDYILQRIDLDDAFCEQLNNILSEVTKALSDDN